MTSVCNSSEFQEPVSGSRPAPFSTSGSVNSVHKLAPRFGRTSNITAVIVLEGQEQNDLTEDYLRGVAASAIIMFVVILTWIVALLILKCCGRRRVGVFSGQPVTLYTEHGVQENTRGEDISETRNEQENPYEDIFSETDVTPQITNTTRWDGTSSSHDLQKNNLRMDGDGENPGQFKNRVQRMRRLRITAVFAGIGVFVGSILSVTKGLTHLQSGIDNSRSGLLEGRRLALEAASLIELYRTTENSLVNDVNDIIPRLNTFCPNVRERICEVTQAGRLTETCDYTDIPYGDVLEALDLPNIDANVVFDEATAALDGQGLGPEDLPDETDSAIPPEFPDNLPGNIGMTTVRQPGSRALQNSDSLERIQEDVEAFADDLLRYEQKIEDFEWIFTLAKAFALVVAILDIFVVICFLLAWRHDATLVERGAQGDSPAPQNSVYQFLKSWILLPFFILVVIVSWILSMGFAVGSITTSDMCYESPDPRVLAFVDSLEDWKSTLVYDFVTYYLNRCPAEMEPFAFEETAQQVTGIVSTLGAFLGQVQDGADTVEAICGSDPGRTISLADLLVDQMCSVTIVIQRIQRFLSCDNWYPLYSLVTHEAVCSEAAPAFLWLAATQFVIIVCAMVLFTVRAGLYESKYEESDTTSERSGSNGEHYDSPEE